MRGATKGNECQTQEIGLVAPVVIVVTQATLGEEEAGVD